MKRAAAILLGLAAAFALTACGGRMIGTVRGAEWQELVIDGVGYVRTFDSGLSYSDKGRYLGRVSDGRTVFRAYSVKSDPAEEYIYCMWEYEGLIYQKAGGA